MIRLLSVLAVLQLFAASDAMAVKTQWAVSDGGNGHYYEVVVAPARVSWEQARSIAASRGGYLATLTSAAEDAFVYALASPEAVPGAWISVYGPWLGGFQRPGSAEPAAGWQWVNGEGDFGYTHWDPRGPNDGGDGSGGTKESYLHYINERPVGTWNDFFDDGTLSSLVVESAIPEPATWLSMIIGLAGLLASVRRRVGDSRQEAQFRVRPFA